MIWQVVGLSSDSNDVSNFLTSYAELTVPDAVVAGRGASAGTDGRRWARHGFFRDGSEGGRRFEICTGVVERCSEGEATGEVGSEGIVGGGRGGNRVCEKSNDRSCLSVFHNVVENFYK